MAVGTSIIIDGSMSDWTPILTDPDNNTYDGSPDLDAPISDQGRDLTRFAFTQDFTQLYLYIKRAGSTNNSVDVVYYIDIDNDNKMTLNEPVLALNWGGANGNVSAKIYNYTPVNVIGDVMGTDGIDLPGSITSRSTIGNIGMGSLDGESAEVAIPFSFLTRVTGVVILDQLQYNENFKFQISTINGSVGSIPHSNSINDNFGGCFSGFISQILLPVTLYNFSGNEKNNKIYLEWAVAENETAERFEVERSTDGKNFITAALIFSSEKIGNEIYKFYEPATEGKMQYRLKMFDKNMRVEYSKIIVFNKGLDDLQKQLKVYQLSPGKLCLSFSAVSMQDMQLNLYDFAGRAIQKEAFKSFEGYNNYILSLKRGVNAGIYIVELTSRLNRSTQKFLIQ